MYLTFVLRALGYDDKAGDFDWTAAWELTEDLGITLPGQFEDGNIELIRGEMAFVSLRALVAEMKDGGSLLFNLVDAGIISEEQLEEFFELIEELGELDEVFGEDFFTALLEIIEELAEAELISEELAEKFTEAIEDILDEEEETTTTAAPPPPSGGGETTTEPPTTDPEPAEVFELTIEFENATVTSFVDGKMVTASRSSFTIDVEEGKLVFLEVELDANYVFATITSLVDFWVGIASPTSLRIVFEGSIEENTTIKLEFLNNADLAIATSKLMVGMKEGRLEVDELTEDAVESAIEALGLPTGVEVILEEWEEGNGIEEDEGIYVVFKAGGNETFPIWIGLKLKA
jgi:hypothetical protein